MNTQLLPLLALLLLSPSLAGAAASASAPASITKAAESCQAAVVDTIKEMRGREAQDVQFNKDTRVLPPSSGEDTDIRGSGRYRGSSERPMPFTYGCAFNTRTGATSGVVFRDAGAARTSEENPWQPDLTNVSPEACEAAVAAALKDKHPRVGRIAFGSDSRQLRPAPNGRSSLEGLGAVARAPGMNAAPFTYRCEFEPRSGKILSVQTSD